MAFEILSSLAGLKEDVNLRHERYELIINFKDDHSRVDQKKQTFWL